MIFEADFFCITIHLANTAAFLCSRPYTRQSGESMAVGPSGNAPSGEEMGKDTSKKETTEMSWGLWRPRAGLILV